jgi:hypothetical protein
MAKTLTMEDTYQTQVPGENVLDGMDISLTQASSGKRFINLLIDRLFLYLLWKFFMVKFTVTIISLFGIFSRQCGRYPHQPQNCSFSQP